MSNVNTKAMEESERLKSITVFNSGYEGESMCGARAIDIVNGMVISGEGVARSYTDAKPIPLRDRHQLIGPLEFYMACES